MKSTILLAREYGPVNVLEFAERELQNLAPGMARIEVRAAESTMNRISLPPPPSIRWLREMRCFAK